MRDIARMAGVSTATISRVLHGSALVDPRTAERVRAIVQQANYVPNTTGTALKSGRSGIYGLIVPDIRNPFFADYVHHFERAVVRRDQEMLLAITDHAPEEMQRSTRRMLMRGVDGIVILESEIETRAYETMLRNRVPLVTLNRLTVEPGVSDVAVDALSGMKMAIRHLRELGHERVGFLGGRPGQAISAAREQAFRKAMRANRLAVVPEAIQPAEFTVEGGYRAMKLLLAQPDPVTAVQCANDLSAIGAMQAIRERGLRPGREVSVIGLDDIDLCTMVDPPLTTLHLSRSRMVELSLQALAKLIQAPHAPGEQLVVGVELIVRGSTGPKG